MVSSGRAPASLFLFFHQFFLEEVRVALGPSFRLGLYKQPQRRDQAPNLPWHSLFPGTHIHVTPHRTPGLETRPTTRTNAHTGTGRQEGSPLLDALNPHHDRKKNEKCLQTILLGWASRQGGSEKPGGFTYKHQSFPESITWPRPCLARSR